MAHKVKALQQWCKLQVEGYRDVNITNMTSSWRSGLAFCALIHRYRPDLIDYDSLSKDNVYDNNELAFRVAKESLDIPDLLEAEDMLAMAVPDKLCIVTYVSQYYNVMRNLTPAGGPGKRASPLKRPQTTTPVEETQAKRLITEVKTKDTERPTVGVRSTTKVSLGDKCHICHQKVYLMERHLEGGKLYHRHCFRETQKSSFRAYRGGYAARQKNSKENISPTGPDKPSSNGTTNGTTPAASAKSMAKMWDTKIADGKRAPAPSSSVSPPPSASTPSPALAENSRFQLPSPKATTKTSLSPTSQPTAKTSLPSTAMTSVSPTPQARGKTSLSPTQQARPKTWGVQSEVKPRTARPWSPPSAAAAPSHTAQGAKSLSPVSPASSSSSSSSSPSQSRFTGPTSPPFLPRSFSPGSGPLSPSAEGLFPHFRNEPASRNNDATTARKVEAMEVDEDLNLGGRSAVTAAASASPPPRPPPPASPKSPTPSPQQTSPLSPTAAEPRWKTDKALKMNLLASLSNIRQRYDTKEDSVPPRGASTRDQAPSSISSTVQESPKKADQPRSILKSEEGSGGRGAKPILKHKDPVSFTDSDPSDTSRPLRSILKAGGDTEPSPSVTETSPRSILKHHEEDEDIMPRPAGHSILKVDMSSPSPSSMDTTAGDVLRRSILKTKDTSSGICDSESTSHQEDSSRPVRSILKSRKSSGDSLLGSSGDELEDISPRPILKTSPRAENVVSPTSEPKSILKTKNLPSYPASDSPRDSPKPILKSRESSPTRSMSPLRVVEPIKPILKKNTDTPTPGDRSPSGPSALRAQQSGDNTQSTSVFAAFKSINTKNYTSSSLGLGSDEKAPLLGKNSDNFNTFSTNTNSSVTAAKSQQGFSGGRQSRPGIDHDPPVSQSNGAKTADKAQSLARAKEESKPEWMIEAEKRQAARKGKYEDPEKVPIKKGDVSDKAPEKKVQDKPSSVGSDRVFNGEGGRKVKAAQPVPMEADNRPEWQKEAEKRQAMRNGKYVDPEKGPVRPTDRPVGDLTIEKQTLKDKPSKPPLPKTRPPSSTSTLTAGSAGAKRPKSSMNPPPKPMRSPLPQRPQNKERPKTELPSVLGKPRWQEEAERRQALRQTDTQSDLTELQRNKKSPAPARPPPPTVQGGKKKVVPDSKFNFDDTMDVQSTNGGSEYAEIGPPSRRILRGKPVAGQTDKDSKFYNRPLPPVPADQDINAPPKRRVAAEARMSSQTILRHLEELDAELQEMEQQGRQLEEKIRSESDDAMDEADLMIAWFEMVNKKNELVRKESDLMYKQRQQELEGQHEELEYDLRCLMEKTDKTASEKIREEALLQELVETVMLRNNIVDSIEEDRIRYLEEDHDIAVMMEAKGFSLKEESTEEPAPASPKKKNGKDKKKKDKNRRLVKSCVQ